LEVGRQGVGVLVEAEGADQSGRQQEEGDGFFAE
jgi:hypothetical protein